MINKDDLLKDLKRDFSAEEEITGKLTDFYKALEWRRYVNPKYHKNIEDGLMTMKKDTEKHAEMIKEMIKYVEESNKNEF